jgi:hypothetical protein
MLLNHQDSPIANSLWKKYLNVAHVQDAQHNMQQGEKFDTKRAEATNTRQDENRSVGI